ncbi:hypothetical protein EGH24_02960 [Halonotius terrestris]|uniref:Uncharacterized protein n=1 Tax=Halonotius terrestris TaxID=2487750 RepID=A0A8J8P9Z3_9EURY|nr:hypothetical protein [Halonotius terrestris]TQQ83758.1 hypothetical protein EGH24_02960 [Halonotius terrestris]
MTPPAEPPGSSTGPPDRQALRLLERQCATTPLVADTEFQPSATEPRRLLARLDTDAFPETVAAARLDIRWFTTGDFSLHYVETTTNGDQWECRWDRHPNPHNARLHFHQPPDAEAIRDLSVDSRHPLDVYATVFAAIQQRLAARWSDGS